MTGLNTTRMAAAVALGLLTAAVAGCGALIDESNIVIARMGDEEITRGDLRFYLRSLSDVERPEVRTRSDVREVVDRMIEERIKGDLAVKYADQPEVEVPFEAALAEYFRRNPEEPRQWSPALEAMGITEQDYAFMEENRKLAAEDLRQELMGERALAFLAMQGAQQGSLPVEEADLRAEYEARRDELQTPEVLTITALCFPITGGQTEAARRAADALQRLRAGETIEDLRVEVRESGEGFVIGSQLANTGAEPAFASFWESASGAEEGEIVGPVMIRGWTVPRQNPQTGQVEAGLLPPLFAVCRIDERVPPQEMTFEQAQRIIAPQVFLPKMMAQLRDEYGVEIYEDKLPDPSFQGEQSVVVKQETEVF